MDGKLIIEKGYRIEVTSWENDGDDYRTIVHTVSTIEDVMFIKMILSQSTSKYDGVENILNIGNAMEDEYETYEEPIISFMKTITNFSIFDPKKLNDKELFNKFMDVISRYLGVSEYYFSRVLEKITVYYSDVDVFLKEVEI